MKQRINHSFGGGIMKDLYGTEYNLDDFLECAGDKKLVVFGAGKYGNLIYNTIKEKNIDVFAVCDNNKEKLCEIRNQYPVMSIDELKDNIEEYYFIIAITKIKIIKEIKKQLYSIGVKYERMIIPLPDAKTGYFDSLIMFDSEFCVQAVKEQWRNARKNIRQIADYFEMNDLFDLVLFGYKELDGWLESDLSDSKVIIKDVIYSLDEFDDNKKIDAVVVLDEVNYEMIEEQLMKRTEVPIISIWDVVRF